MAALGLKMADREQKLSSLILLVSGYVEEAFVVTSKQAKETGQGLVGLIDAKGGDAANFDFEELKQLIDKDLGKRYEWRDLAQKETAEKRQKATVDSYNAYLDSQRKSPFKKW
jgi:hypothetical protein